MTDTPGVVVIHDKGMKVPVEIHGHRIGFGTSQRDDSTSWAEIEIYANDDETYTVHRAGKSLIYHRKDTRCMTREQRQRGDPAGVEDLPDDAEPCDRCEPPWPQELPDGPGTIRYEFTRHTFDQCETPRQCYDKLTQIRHRDRSRTVQVSKPVKDALREAARNDTGFARLWQELDRPKPVSFGARASSA